MGIHEESCGSIPYLSGAPGGDQGRSRVSAMREASARGMLLTVKEVPEVENAIDTRPVKRVNGVCFIMTTSTFSYFT